MQDKLAALLARTRAQIRATEQATLKAKLEKKWGTPEERQRAAEAIAADYARRLAERAKFRRLLADDELDGLRFRFLWKHLYSGEDIDSFRAWVDSRMAAEEKKRA